MKHHPGVMKAETYQSRSIGANDTVTVSFVDDELGASIGKYFLGDSHQLFKWAKITLHAV